MAGDSLWRQSRVASHQPPHRVDEGSVLRLGKGSVIIALKFDAHRKIVEPGSPYAQRRVPPAGATGMPGTLVAGNKLQQAAVAPDKEVRRHGSRREGSRTHGRQ